MAAFSAAALPAGLAFCPPGGKAREAERDRTMPAKAWPASPGFGPPGSSGNGSPRNCPSGTISPRFHKRHGAMGASPAGRGGHSPRKTDAGQHQRPETPGGPLSGGRLRRLGQAARVIRQALRRAAEETAEGQRLSLLQLGGAQLPAGEGLPGDLRLSRPDLLEKTAALARGQELFRQSHRASSHQVSCCQNSRIPGAMPAQTGGNSAASRVIWAPAAAAYPPAGGRRGRDPPL